MSEQQSNEERWRARENAEESRPREDKVMELLEQQLVYSMHYECPKIEKAVYEVLCAVPEDTWEVLERLAWRVHYVACSYVVKEHILPCSTEVVQTVVYLGGDLEQESYDIVLAEIAHEIAHVVLGHDALAIDTPITCEFDACALATQWGFREQMIELVKRMASEENFNNSWADCVRRIEELKTI